MRRRCVRLRGRFAPILAGRGGFLDLHQMTSNPGRMLLSGCLIVLLCQVLRGTLRGCAGKGLTSGGSWTRKEEPSSA
eukprot:1136928-Pelagomonas_calceolata.AAC.4